MPTSTNVFTSLGFNFNIKKREGGLGEGAAPPPRAEWKHLFSHVMLLVFNRRLVRKNRNLSTEDAAPPPKAECKHLFSHVIQCNAVSFQEKVGSQKCKLRAMVMVSIHTTMFTTSSYQPQLMYLRAWVLI